MTSCSLDTLLFNGMWLALIIALPWAKIIANKQRCWTLSLTFDSLYLVITYSDDCKFGSRNQRHRKPNTPIESKIEDGVVSNFTLTLAIWPRIGRMCKMNYLFGRNFQEITLNAKCVLRGQSRAGEDPWNAWHLIGRRCQHLAVLISWPK